MKDEKINDVKGISLQKFFERIYLQVYIFWRIDYAI
jgi:hypothetical protein